MGLDLMRILRGWDAAGKPELEGVELAIVQSPPAPAPPAAPPAKRDEPVVHTPAPDQLSDRERRVILKEAGLDAREYLATLAGKLSPFEINNLGLLYMLCALDDAERPATMPFDLTATDGSKIAAGTPVKRVDLLKHANEHRGPAPMMGKGGPDLVGSTPLLKPGETTLAPLPDAPDPRAVSQEKQFELLAGSPSGRVILQGSEEGRAYLQKYDKARRF